MTYDRAIELAKASLPSDADELAILQKAGEIAWEETKRASAAVDARLAAPKAVCKNCKWWDKHHVYDRGTCDRPDEEDLSKHPDEAFVSVSVSDDYGLFVQLKTGPEFGCVKFQKKEEEKD